jgi:hypothetical protein
VLVVLRLRIEPRLLLRRRAHELLGNRVRPHRAPSSAPAAPVRVPAAPPARHALREPYILPAPARAAARPKAPIGVHRLTRAPLPPRAARARRAHRRACVRAPPCTGCNSRSGSCGRRRGGGGHGGADGGDGPRDGDIVRDEALVVHRVWDLGGGRDDGLPVDDEAEVVRPRREVDRRREGLRGRPVSK